MSHGRKETFNGDLLLYNKYTFELLCDKTYNLKIEF